MKHHACILTLTIAGLTWGMTPAWALFGEDKAELLKGAKITLVEAVEKALTSVEGKAVEAELEKEGDNTVFEIEVIDETGTTQKIYIDAGSGNVLKIKKK
jgi:uncharacterized membrane protein YkoI